MNRSHESLVKYDSPTLINTSGRDGTKDPSSAAGGVGVTSSSSTSTEDILNSILPPREWTEDGQLWVQYVSSVPSTRHDIVNLQQELDKKLLLRKARETGICPIREELYSQCFDELIREITINCAERGLLLLRIRDEIKMTISSYQSLYESSIAFGMRKSLQSKQIKTKLEKETSQLNRECHQLKKEIDQINEQIITIKQNYDNKQENLKIKHENDIKQIKQQNSSLKQELEKLLTLQQQQ